MENKRKMERQKSKKDAILYDSYAGLSEFEVGMKRGVFDAGIDYDVKKSSASCLVQDVQQITFGAFNSRFWALRKHISCLHDQQIEKLPFYAWQCISLTLKHREVDFVFKDEIQQNKFVKYLIYRMKTIDGRKESAVPILKAMESQPRKEGVSLEKQEKMNQQEVIRKCYLKYLVIKLRQKISFIAFQKKMTIIELFLVSIKKTYQSLVAEGHY